MTHPATETVFFDLDGTLLDTTYLHTMAWWRTLDELGQRRPMALIHPLIGMGGTELLAQLLGTAPPAALEGHSRHFASLRDEITPLPGARRLLRHLSSRGLQLVVVTASKEEVLGDLLGSLGCDDVIDAVIDGEMVERAKPAPDPFLVAMARTGALPARSLAIGDSVWDMRSAAKAGLASLGVTSGGTPAQLLLEAGASEVFAGPWQLFGEFDDGDRAMRSPRFDSVNSG